MKESCCDRCQDSRNSLRRRLVHWGQTLPYQLGLASVLVRRLRTLMPLSPAAAPDQHQRSTVLSSALDWSASEPIESCVCEESDRNMMTSATKTVGDAAVTDTVNNSSFIGSSSKKARILPDVCSSASKMSYSVCQAETYPTSESVKLGGSRQLSYDICQTTAAVSMNNSWVSDLPEDQPLDLSCRRLPLQATDSELANSPLEGTSSNFSETNAYGSIRRTESGFGKTARRSYTERQMLAALADIGSGRLGTRRAATIYGIPRSTLRNKVYRMSAERLAAAPAPARPDSRPASAERLDFGTAEEQSTDAPSMAIHLFKDRLIQMALESSRLAASSPGSSAQTSQIAANSDDITSVDNNFSSFWETFIQYMSHERLHRLSSSVPVSSSLTLPKERCEQLFISTLASSNSATSQMESVTVNEESDAQIETQLQPTVSQSGLSIQHDKTNYSLVKTKNNCKSMSITKLAVKAPAVKGSRPKRGKYRNYNRDNLASAVRAVQMGEMSVHRAGNHYGVPHSTLEYKVKHLQIDRYQRSSLVLPYPLSPQPRQTAVPSVVYTSPNVSIPNSIAIESPKHVSLPSLLPMTVLHKTRLANSTSQSGDNAKHQMGTTSPAPITYCDISTFSPSDSPQHLESSNEVATCLAPTSNGNKKKSGIVWSSQACLGVATNTDSTRNCSLFSY